MNKTIKTLEARAMFEREYDEEEIDDLMDIYEDVVKNIGFTDNRRDQRFIVKFHDICYYMPDEETCEKYEFNFDGWFGDFCDMQYENIMDELKQLDIDVDDLLTKTCCGSYQAFNLYIPEITEDNAIELTMQIYNEGLNCEYASKYAHTVAVLQDLEDNYVEYWLDYLKINEVPEALVKEIEYNRDKDMERRSAKK